MIAKPRHVFTFAMSFLSTAAYNAAISPTRPGVAVVTGGKSGIGRALAEKIATFPFIEKVVAVSRSITAQDVEGSPKLVALAADVGTQDGRDLIVSTVESLCDKKTKQLRFLIHSAGTIDPIKPVIEVKPDELRHAMNINCESPFFLTTALYPFMEDDTIAGRVLHVSSGAAHGAPPVGWGSYGISKAAFFQSFKVLEREFRETLGGKVVVGSFKPGIVDTAMQGNIRQSSVEDFPSVQAFKKFKDMAVRGDVKKAYPPPNGALDTPENAAHFAEFLLLGTSDDEFAGKDNDNEWDIRNKAFYHRWIPEENLPKEG
jgi:NAD(P)-dependent dehydrogenase (short-subunit alcohol dehydrogenase family)